MSNRVCLGVVTGARGVRGEVHVKTFTQVAADIGVYGNLSDAAGKRRFTVQAVKAAKNGAALKFEGVSDRDAAEALKGLELYVDREALPQPDDGEFYHADLIGLAAELPDGTRLGSVKALEDYGAGDVIEIERDGEMPVLLPFTSEAVPEIDLENGRVVVDVPAELLESGSAKTKARQKRRKKGS